MSVLETRGGVPHVRRINAIPAAAPGRYHKFPGPSKYLQIRTGLTQIKLYFNEADMTADTNYIGPVNEWEGPVESVGIWMRGDGGDSDVQLVAYIRRG